MPKDAQKCRMYIARITYRAAKRASARDLGIRIKNRLENKKGRMNNQRLFAGFQAAIQQFGNPFAGKWPRRQDGVARTQRLYARRYAGAGGVA